jgi:hypothetical protein
MSKKEDPWTQNWSNNLSSSWLSFLDGPSSSSSLVPNNFSLI